MSGEKKLNGAIKTLFQTGGNVIPGTGVWYFLIIKTILSIM